MQMQMTILRGPGKRRLSLARILVIACLPIAMAGCEHDRIGPQVAGWQLIDPEQRHPILVSQQPTVLNLHVASGSEGLTPSQRGRVMDFIDRNQICECGGASKRMFFRAQEQGIEARQCFGLLLAAPFSTGHYWTEFKIDGEWTPFDPLLLGLLHATSRLDQQAWPTHRSNSAALHRLCVIDSYDANGVPELDNYIDEPYVSNPLVIMDGQVLAVSLPTELSQHPAEASDRNLQPQWTQKAVG